VLAAQLAITGVIGLIALLGLAWTSGSVIRNNLGDWASQWANELNELGAPLYRRDQHEAVLSVERFVAKYREIQHVTWYGEDGSVLLSVAGLAADPRGREPLAAPLVSELAGKAGVQPAYLLTEELDDDHFRLSGPIWIESLPGDGLFEFDPATTRPTVDLLGFVSIDLDFSGYRSAFLPRLAAASAVLLLLLAASWAGGRALLKRALLPLSQLQQPLAQLADGDTKVAFPRSPHRELQAIVSALEHTIRQLQRREQRLLHLANHDPLTGLLNRHSFLKELEAEIELCAGKSRQSALFFIDLDQFKYVNDTCGHAAGDQLLKLAAEQIRYAVRAEDLVARFGGDEFVVLLKDITRQQAKIAAGQVLEQMRGLSHVAEEQVFHLQCSIGVATIASAKFSAHELIAQADIACQAAKAHGRNRVELYSVAGKQSEQMVKDVRWSQTIRDALANDALELHYQPLLHIRSGQVSHYEALLRLRTERGLVGPQTFLPAAVRFGLMADIDLWVVRAAIGALANLGDGKLRLSMNLSSFAFENETFAGNVRGWLREHGVEGERVVFEITEQLAVRFAVNTDRQIAQLRDLGCRFAVDDFGTGYSSFSYLKRLPVDYLKIDGSFIKNLTRDRVDQSMVRMVGDVAKAAGMETVAEYVHNAATLTLLATYGIDYAQGFYIGRATPQPEPVNLAGPRVVASRS
jgi:diguanylate cyclase (GGDEF)-like protein